MKHSTYILTLAVLLVAGQAVRAAQGADIPELKRLLEQRSTDPNISINTFFDPNTPISMQGKQLQNADLYAGSSKNLRGANLQNANLSGLITGGYAIDIEAGLLVSRYADFTNANVAGANFTGADLQYARFINANVSGANFTKADFTGANFTRCIGFASTIIDSGTNFQDVIGLTAEQKAYARSKGAQNVPVEDRVIHIVYVNDLPKTESPVAPIIKGIQ